MQLLIRDNSPPMVAAPVQCDVDGIPKGLHSVFLTFGVRFWILNSLISALWQRRLALKNRSHFAPLFLYLSVGSVGQMAFGVQIVLDRLLPRAAVNPLAVGRLHRNPVEALGNSLADDRRAALLHLAEPQETFAHAVKLVAVGPIGLVHDRAAPLDHVNHVRQQAVRPMSGAGEIVDNDRDLDALQLAELSGVRELL